MLNGIVIPLREFSDAQEILTPGVYRLTFSNPTVFFEFDNEKNISGIELPVPFSSFKIQVVTYQFIESKNQFEIVIRLFDGRPDDDLNLAGVGVLFASILASIAFITLGVVVFVKGEEIIYLPSIAIIIASAVIFFKQITGFFK